MRIREQQFVGGSADKGGSAASIGSAISGITAGQAALAGTLVTTGGTMMKDYAAAKDAEEKEKKEKAELELNGKYKLKMRGRDTGATQTEGESQAVRSTGGGESVNAQTGDVTTDEGGTVYNSPMAKLSNVEQQKGQAYYDSSTDSYKGQK